MRIGPALALALVAFAGTARAETAPPWDTGCLPADAVVPSTLPANVTGIPILAPVDMVTASLLAADGTVVPTKLVPDGGYAVLVPLNPLTAGVSYTVRWSDECSEYRTKSFLATPGVALPSAAGTAVVGPYRDYFTGKCDSSGRPYGSRTQLVYLAESPDMTPWLAVSQLSLVVDGRETSSVHGNAGSVGDVSISCPSADETHKVAVRVRIPNGPAFITPDVGAVMECPDLPPKACDDEPIDEAPIAAGTDAGPVDASNGATGDDLVRAGCHYSRGGLGGVMWALGMGAALAMWRRRAR